MALTAMSVAFASSAQAAEFHCSVEPCGYTLKPDGTGKTSHQVFAATNSAGESLSFTCPEISGEATTAGKTNSILSVSSLGMGVGCTGFGAAASYRLNGCRFAFGAAGTLAVTNCPKGIEFEVGATGCILRISEQGPVNGVVFHNIGQEASNTTEITGEISKLPLAGALIGTTAQCLINVTKTPITFEYRTGNFLLTGESGSMANVWWA
ncbi:MAG: hypothetical protein ABW065_09280 [Solirubrobacterales bacterium]